MYFVNQFTLHLLKYAVAARSRDCTHITGAHQRAIAPSIFHKYFWIEIAEITASGPISTEM